MHNRRILGLGVNRSSAAEISRSSEASDFIRKMKMADRHSQVGQVMQS